MEKFVIDTNILIAAVPVYSPHHWIWADLTSNKFILCVITEILHEYEEVLSRYFGPEFSDFIMGILDELPNLEFVIS